MVVTLPLPPQVTKFFPNQLAVILQWFAFWAFAGLLILPFLLCVHRLVTNSLGRTKRIREVLDDRTAPKTVVVMPVYKEEPEVLIKAIDSVVDCDYPANCIHVFLSYDGGVVDEPYLRVISHLGIPITLKSYPQSIDVSYHVWYTLHIRLSQAMDWRRALEDNHYNNKEMWLLMLVLCKYCASPGSLTW